MKNLDSFSHTRGESIYLDDIPLIAGTLFAASFGSPVAHGIIESLTLDDALLVPGIVKILTFEDIPGKNQIGGIVADEPLFAEKEVHCIGMPVALVVAQTAEAAYAAVKKIKINISPLPIITDPRDAYAEGQLIVSPRTFRLGNTSVAWDNCDHIFEGIAETNGQEHLYIETQGAYSVPLENNALKIFSSTQGPTAVQRHAAEVLNIPMHRLEVEVTRLGGGFGGKEDQATVWAILTALAALLLKKPVKYSLHRMEDMQMTGKRNPYSSDFKIGLNKELKILAYEVSFYQNAGCSADLSPAVLERTLFHATNSYFIPNVTATAYSCSTNLPSNTAFRGFGGPQGMFVIESAIAKAAGELGISAAQIQKRNLLNTADEFPYGQKAISEAGNCWKLAEELYKIEDIEKEIILFNKENINYRKGISFMPICFGISFTKILMNQARALVHVYQDGSVGISTGAVEMGQGVNTKMLQVAVAIFSISPSKVKIHSTNTFRIANTSPSAASSTADLNGKAVQMACQHILDRLKIVAASLTLSEPGSITIKNELIYTGDTLSPISWEQLVAAAYINRVNLSEHAHYTTPGIHYNQATEKGHPFAYHVYGTAITMVTVDCLRGIYEFDWVKVVHDNGSSMNHSVDRGQLEGGIVQGIGWMTSEEIVYDSGGRLRSNALSTYKVPDIYAVPKHIELNYLDNGNDNPAIFRSKAVGEPPLMYGLGAFFAIRNAIKSFNPIADVPFVTPLTPEKVLCSLYSKSPSHVNELPQKKTEYLATLI